MSRIDRVRSWLFDRDMGRRSDSALWVIVILAGSVLAGVAVWSVTSGVDTDGSSSTLLGYVLWAVTSPWAPFVVMVLAGRTLWWGRGRVKARQAAHETPLSQRTVQRLGTEVRTTDGARRVLVWADDDRERVDREIDRKLRVEEDDILDATPTPDGDVSASSQHDGRVERMGGEEPGELDTIDNAHHEDRVGWRDAVRLWAMDVAASADRSDVLLKAVAPAVIVVGVSLLALGLWVSGPVFVGVLAVGALVGALNLIRTHWTRSRRVQRLREDDDREGWGQVSVPVKPVETGETDAFIGWVAGECYASTDRDEFVEEVALRALQAARGEEVWPSILTLNAHMYRSYIPALSGVEDLERERVITELIETVQDHGLIPRTKLIEEVVNHDRDSGGVRGRVSGGSGRGYDPRLVLQEYEDLADGERAALVECDVTVTVDGEEREIRAVQLRTDMTGMIDDETRAQFNSLFSVYASNDRDCRYGDPDPDVPDTTSIPVQPAHDPCDEFLDHFGIDQEVTYDSE